MVSAVNLFVRSFYEIYNLNFLSFPPSSVTILLAFLSFFLFSFIFIKEQQIASFLLSKLLCFEVSRVYIYFIA